MFGEQLKDARKKAKLTQEELAGLANVHPTYISHLENNKKSPTLDTLFRICEPLGISASKLIARVEKTRK